MGAINRRDFLRAGLVASASMLAVGGSLDLYANPYGLPVGLQLVGRPWEEGTILSMAAAVEGELGQLPLPPPPRLGGLAW